MEAELLNWSRARRETQEQIPSHGNQEDKDYSMKCPFLAFRLSIFHYILLMIAAAAYLEAQTRPLPKPTKVRVVSIVIQPSTENQPPPVSGPQQAVVDTTYVPATGQTITVGAGGNFQAALDKAQPGDVITLAA